METQQDINYNRIADAIDFYRTHLTQQPRLEQAAAHVHISPFHFQRMFKEWAGVTPKQFLQYLSLEHAKGILKEHQATLFDTAEETGLSGTSRLHDLFIKVEGMTPGEYKNGGEQLRINYSFAESPFGNLIGATQLHIAPSFALPHHAGSSPRLRGSAPIWWRGWMCKLNRVPASVNG